VWTVASQNPKETRYAQMFARHFRVGGSTRYRLRFACLRRRARSGGSYSRRQFTGASRPRLAAHFSGLFLRFVPVPHPTPKRWWGAAERQKRELPLLDQWRGHSLLLELMHRRAVPAPECPMFASESSQHLAANDPTRGTAQPASSVAGELGFEPRLTESESAVLPLNYSPTMPRARAARTRKTRLAAPGRFRAYARACQGSDADRFWRRAGRRTGHPSFPGAAKRRTQSRDRPASPTPCRGAFRPHHLKRRLTIRVCCPAFSAVASQRP
jgi:hypothetical protein